MAERPLPDGVVCGDRTHVHPADPAYVFEALTTGARKWLRLERGEQLPEVLDATPPTASPGRVLWSSLWPVSPGDTVEFTIGADRKGTSVRFTWRSPAPPDARGIAITCQRLNKKIGDQLRGVTGYGGSL